MGHLSLHIHGIGHNYYCANAEGTIKSDDCLRAIWEHYRHPIAGSHPQLAQGGGKTAHLVSQLLISEAGADELGSGHLGKLLGRLFQPKV